MENKTIDNLIVCSLNCQGINRSKDFINNFLTDNACDILCLQETWTNYSNINILGNIHNDFLFTGISGVDHTVEILQGRPLVVLWSFGPLVLWLIMLTLSLLTVLIILRMFYIHTILMTL